jgi:ribose/xylose/arabinose/galactoside ABC-type transport system permease subunit
MQHVATPTPATTPRRRSRRVGLGRSGLSLALFYVVVVGAFSAASPAFRTTANLVEILTDYSYVGILAVGVSFPILLAGIDLSIGAIVGLVGMTAFDLMLLIGHLPGPVVIPICLLVGIAAGLVNGALVAWVGLNPFIATLATLATYRGINWAISGRQIKEELATTAITDQTFLKIDGSIENVPWIGTVPYVFLYLLVVVAVAWFVLRKTKLGRDIYAVGGNERAARLAGINVTRVKLFAYAVSGFCAAIVALVLTSRFETSPEDLGTGFELSAISAAVIGGVSLAGGVGGPIGPALGAFLVGTLYVGLTLMNVTTYAQGVVAGVVLILAVAYDRFTVRRAARR